MPKKPRARSNGEGSIFKLPNGKWKACLTVGWVGGKRQRKTRTCKSQADAKAALLKMRNESGQLLIQDPDAVTLRQFLDRWLECAVKPHRSENTYVSYQSVVRIHISPRIGSVPLTKTNPLHVEDFISKMEADGVGSRTQENAYVVLSLALQHAVDLRLILHNPCKAIERPKHERERIFPLTLTETQKLLQETKGTRHYAFYAMALGTGARQGELAGLEWGDVDLKGGTVRIERQATEISGKIVVRKPKSKSSVRTIPLSPQLVTALIEHRADLLRRGLAGNKLVFPATHGGHLHRSTFARRHWLPLLDRLGIERRGLHHARHTFACLSLAAGVEIDILSKWLGHSKPSTTLDIYVHVTPDRNATATSKLDRLFG
jgi:integrase